MNRVCKRAFLVSLFLCNSLLVFSANSTLQDIDNYYYKGTISDEPIVIYINKNGSNIIGHYYYSKYGIPISISGSVEENGHIILHEYIKETNKIQSEKKSTGYFYITTLTKENCEGTWHSVDNKRQYPFKVSSFTNNGITIATHKIKQVKVQNTTIEIDDDTTDLQFNMEVTISYIQLKHTQNNKGVSLINNKLKSIIVTTAWDMIGRTKKSENKKSGFTFEKTPDALMQKLETLSEGNYFAQNGVFYSINTSVIFNEDDILTIAVSTDRFEGGAHGLHLVTYYNFDLSSGKELRLEDILSGKGISQLGKVKEAYCEDVPEASPELFRNINNFYVTRFGIGFFYNVYTIGSYASGPMEFILPYDRIKYLIKTKSILKNIL